MSKVRVRLDGYEHGIDEYGEPRRNWYRTITNVDPMETNAYAFLGEWLPKDKEVDIEIGTVLIEKIPIKGGSHVWRCGVACESGIDWGIEYDRGSFPSFRDEVERLWRLQTGLE